MSILVWLDDVRPPEKEGWVWVKTADAAIELLETGDVTALDLDHDLAFEHYAGVSDANEILVPADKPKEKTGLDVCLWLRQRIETDPTFKLPAVRLHSMNPVGRANMAAVMEDIWHLVREREANNESSGGE